MSDRTKQMAEERLEAALRSIEQAQMCLDRAGQHLCNLVGAMAEWQRDGDAYEQVKELWHQVNNLRGKVDLDGLATEAARRRGELGGES